MPTNRELLIARRKNKGLPVTAATATAPAKDTSRRSSRAFTTTQDTGFQGISRREGKATLDKFPGVAEDIIEPGAALAGEFSGLRPQAKTKALAQGGKVAEGTQSFSVSKGRRLTPSVLKGIEAESGSEISPAQRRNMGLGGVPPSLSFGLPTDRLPSFNELGGAIGQLFKHVGGIAKKRRALGLVPGRRTTTTAGQGLKGKDLAGIIVKQLEAATLAGDKDRAAVLEAELEKIKNPQAAQDASDIEAILGG